MPPLARRTRALVTLALVAAALAVPSLSSPAQAVPATAEPGCMVSAPTAYTNDDDHYIPDRSSTSSPITVPAGSGRVFSVRVRTAISHPATGDLALTLTSPEGHDIGLVYREGGGRPDLYDGTWWDDDAGDTDPPGSVYESVMAGRTTNPALAPEQALSNLRGEQASGVWTLTVADIGKDDTGTLTGWTLELTTYPDVVPGLTHVSGTGAVGTVAAGATQDFTAPVSSAVVGDVEDARVALDVVSADPDANAYPDVWLVSPSGTEVSLAVYGTRSAGGGLQVTYTDSADTFGFAYLEPGEYRPFEPLAAFRGEDPAGAWTLRVHPVNAAMQVGWSLDLTLASCGADTTLTAGPSVAGVAQGSTATYTVTATNRRSGPTSGSHAVMTVPAGTQLVSATASQGTCTGADCDLGSIAGGASATATYVLRGTAPGVVQPSVALTQAGGDLAPADNTVSFTTTVTPGPPVVLPPTNPPVPTPDTTKPGIGLSLGRATLERVVARGVKVRVHGTEAGRVALVLKVSRRTATALDVPRRLGSARAVLGAAGTVRVTVTIKKRYRDELAAATRPVAVVVRGTLTDPAGNVGRGSGRRSYA